MEFREFPKMARLSREAIITEKIDGTNAAVVVEALEGFPAAESAVWRANGIAVYAQSRSRLITPADDNFGFAAWVVSHAEELAAGLGVGCHFGEWWGQGIQRKYGQDRKRFSLFNTIRWAAHGSEPQPIQSGDPRATPKMQQVLPACCDLVPVLYRGSFDTTQVYAALDHLREMGSVAAPGFMNPEGVVVFHAAAGVGFKKTLERDDEPKSKGRQ